MDWKSFTKKFDPIKEKITPLKEKIVPYFEKAKKGGYKVLDFTQKQFQERGVMAIRTLAEYEKERENKRLIILFYDTHSEEGKNVLIHTPLWATQAWGDAAVMKLAEKSTAPEVFSHFDVSHPVEMRVWYAGSETFHGETYDAVVAWWRDRCYDGKSESHETETKNTENHEQDTSETEDHEKHGHEKKEEKKSKKK